MGLFSGSSDDGKVQRGAFPKDRALEFTLLHDLIVADCDINPVQV